MAGALTISTLNNDTGVLATQNGMTGIAKAWVNFDGTNGTIRGSFNVSSITVNGTGDYTANFTTAMPNTNYSVSTTGRFQLDGSTNGRYLISANSSAMATTSIRVICVNAADTAFLNPITYCVAVFSS